jgi:hypothetical protein
MTRRDALAQLEAAQRWSLWDFANGTKLAKVSINIAGMGLSNRQSAEWAFIHQCAYDRAGMARRRGGIAVHLNAADVERYAEHLGGVEVFIDRTLPDLAIQPTPVSSPVTEAQQASLPHALSNGNGGTLPVHSTSATLPRTQGRTKARGVRLPIELWDRLDAYCKDSGKFTSGVIGEILDDFLQD